MSDGRTFKIRALKREDEADVMAAVARTSPQSLYRRFFGPKRFFSDQEIAYYMTVDFVNHVCLVAVTDEDGHPAIVAGVRYIVQEPGKAEVSFAVIDQYQGKGIGTALMQHIAGIAREAGIREFTAEVLPDNIPMLKVFIAKLLLAKDLDGLDFADTPVKEASVRDLSNGGFLVEQRNAVLIGGTGTGKSHLAIAIAGACIRGALLWR